MKTREQIYNGEGTQLLRLITTYHVLRYEQVIRFFSRSKEDSIKSLITSLTKQGMPKRKLRVNTAFLSEPLSFALQEYLKEHPLALYRDCVVCFSQIYDKALTLERVRDYDNLEFKQILDTIAAYILADDTGLFCDLYHTTELGGCDCTDVYIMGKAAFPSWVKAWKNQIKTISEIS